MGRPEEKHFFLVSGLKSPIILNCYFGVLKAAPAVKELGGRLILVPFRALRAFLPGRKIG